MALVYADRVFETTTTTGTGVITLAVAQMRAKVMRSLFGSSLRVEG